MGGAMNSEKATELAGEGVTVPFREPAATPALRRQGTLGPRRRMFAAP